MNRTECVILAAGYSSRAKTNKMLLNLGNKTVIEHCIDSFYASCSHIYVVVGYRSEDLRPVLMKYQKVSLVYNEQYPEGMFRSVKEGLKYIKAEQFFLTPGDYPLIQKATVNHLLEGEEPVLVPQYKGISGHPVRMKSCLIPEILSGCYESLAEFVTANSPQLLEVDDIGVITDIDDMEDYRRIITMFS